MALGQKSNILKNNIHLLKLTYYYPDDREVDCYTLESKSLPTII